MKRECYGRGQPQPRWVDGPCEICHVITTCINAIKVGYNGKTVIVCSPKCCETFIRREDERRKKDADVSPI